MNIFNIFLSSWDVSNVIICMGGMFSKTNFNQDISRFMLVTITDIKVECIFWFGSFNQDISDWDVTSVTYMGYI